MTGRKSILNFLELENQLKKNSVQQAIAPTENSVVEIKLDGRISSFMLPSNGSSILDAALEQGADLPYACKGGVCTTCRAKLLEGEVTMDANYGLDETEIKNRYILTCQSHPATAKVVVDFDEK